MTPRRLLKDDAVPTLFAHNKDKQPHKQKSSELREEARANVDFVKMQLRTTNYFKESILNVTRRESKQMEKLREGDVELLREKWISVLFHVQNKQLDRL